jgi:cytochrome c553
VRQLAALLLGVAALPVLAQGYAERFVQRCAPCHGAGGQSTQPLVPSLGGQPSFYAITQLFLFRNERRDNPAMVAVAKTLDDTDLRGFSDAIGSDGAGGKQVARLALQREDYLLHVLQGFKAGTRVGYTQAMNEAIAPVGADELADLAHFLAYLQ